MFGLFQNRRTIPTILNIFQSATVQSVVRYVQTSFPLSTYGIHYPVNATRRRMTVLPSKKRGSQCRQVLFIASIALASIIASIALVSTYLQTKGPLAAESQLTKNSWLAANKEEVTPARDLLLNQPTNTSAVLLAAKKEKVTPARDHLLKWMPLVQNNNSQAMMESKTGSLCVVVRTYIAHKNMLHVLLSGWENIAEKASRKVHIFVANTDAGVSDEESFSFIKDEVNTIISRSASICMAVLPKHMKPKKDLYGYDVTQLMLEGLFTNRSSSEYNCSTYLFTNGDNYYHPDVLKQTGMDGSTDPPAELVGFDFVSHHPQEDIDGKISQNQVLSMKFERGHVDLGSVFLDHNAIRDCKGAGFYARAKKGDNYALDWIFFDKLLKCNVSRHVTHQVLFMHQ
jgi:hypothetical protein